MDPLIEEIRQELLSNVDEKTKQNSQRFFKEKIECYGIKTDVVGKMANKYFRQIKDKPKAEIFSLCAQLYESGILEEAFIACNWPYLVRENYEPADFEVFEKWISNYIHNWATCDTLSNHAIGAFVEKYPEYLARLKDWAKSDNRWMRRASAVSLIIPARKGKFLEDILEIADILLLDKDDRVWMDAQSFKRGSPESNLRLCIVKKGNHAPDSLKVRDRKNASGV